MSWLSTLGGQASGEWRRSKGERQSKSKATATHLCVSGVNLRKPVNISINICVLFQ